MLPAYSVETEACAQALLVAACQTNERGEYVARELAFEQTLDNLEAFGDRLHSVHEMLEERGGCRCSEE